jgi:TonB family protein
MSALPRTLRPVLVQANQVEYKGRLAGYYQRLQRRSGGYFISREEIDRNSSRALSQLLRSVPGISAFPIRSGGSAVRMRGRGCRPLVWLDGIPLPAGEVDLDAFPTSTIHGIELYPGSTTTPPDYTANAGLSSCGTIMLWSRGADTDPPRTRPAKAVDLDRLVQSMSVFSADQVDKPAQLMTLESLTVTYPPELFAGGVGGSVLVEFVVDTAGKIERGTYSVVSSSHALFTAAVAQALESAAYTPALKNGRAVRQAVQQPFNFDPGPRKAAQRMR